MSARTREKLPSVLLGTGRESGTGLHIPCLNQIKSTELIFGVKFHFLNKSRMEVSVSRPNRPEDLEGLSPVHPPI